jgi:lactate 2-monooxygenase
MSDNPGDTRQREIYMGGLAEMTPEVPLAYEDLEAAAMEALDGAAFDYVMGGAGAERTVRANAAAFDRWRLVPRFLRDVAERDLFVEVFGVEQYPFMLAPVGVQSILHEDAELAVARAASAQGVPMVLSSVSSFTIEEVAEALGDTPKWFQLYPSSDREVAASFVARAEAAGYDALVVTVDTPLPGWRERDLQRAYLPFLEGEGIANYTSDPAFRARLDQPPEENPQMAVLEFIDVFGDASLDWEDLAWLCAETDLPVVVKGLLHPADARRATEAGAAGVVVSNHGGRQVDGAIAALDALPRVAEAVADGTAVLFDSGVRRGADAIKALALGADAVLLGRPYAYGLALDGQHGVEEVLRNFRGDLDLTLGLVGHDAVSALDREALVDVWALRLSGLVSG